MEIRRLKTKKKLSLRTCVVHKGAKQVISRRGKNENDCEMYKNEKRSSKAYNSAVVHLQWNLQIGVIIVLVALKLADMQLYSHSTSICLVFAADNVLLDESRTHVKLADFGLARNIQVGKCTHTGGGPVYDQIIPFPQLMHARLPGRVLKKLNVWQVDKGQISTIKRQKSISPSSERMTRSKRSKRRFHYRFYGGHLTFMNLFDTKLKFNMHIYIKLLFMRRPWPFSPFLS